MSYTLSHLGHLALCLLMLISRSLAANLWTQPDSPLIIAHVNSDSKKLIDASFLGTCYICPGLTQQCFRTMLAFGSDVLEMDLQITADNQLAVLHDDDLALVCNDSRRVRDLTVAQLKQIDAAYNFNPEEGYPLRGMGYQVMTFEEVITNIPLVNPATGRAVGIEVEVKPRFAEGGKELADALLLLVAKYGEDRKLYDRLLVASEWCEITSYVSQQSGDRIVTNACETEVNPIGIATLLAPIPLSWLHPLLYSDSQSDAVQVPPYAPFKLATKAFADQVHRTGKRIDYFVINERSQMEEVLDVGADGFVTDRPEVAWEVFVSRGLRSNTQRTPLPPNLVYFPNAVDQMWPYDCWSVTCFLLTFPLTILATILTLIVSLIWWCCCSSKKQPHKR